MPSLSDFLFGEKAKTEQLPTMNPQQQAILSQLLGGLGGATGAGLGNLQQLLSGSPEATKAFEAPFMRQFQEQTIPTLAERFSSLGMGGQQSSAFGHQLGAAGAGLSENLASLRAQLQQNAISQLQGFLGQGLGAQPFAYQHTPGSTGFLGGLAPGIGSGIGMGLTGGFGGAGGGLSSLLNLFKAK